MGERCIKHELKLYEKFLYEIQKSKTMVKYSLGIDMSFKSFHACLSAIGHDQQVKVKASTTFSNNEEGFKLLINWINKHYKQKDLPLVIMMEATGVYSRGVL